MDSIDLLEISNQKYSSLLSNHLICKNCRMVDLDENRTRGGYICPICRKSGNYGKLYFHLRVRTLIDFMQESYLSKQLILDVDDKIIHVKSEANYFSVVIFMITLREVLLQNFLEEIIEIHPKKMELLSNNLVEKTYSQKQNQEFPKLLHVKWEEALKIVSKIDNIDYLYLNKFLIKIVSERNKFIHEGFPYLISKKLAEECISKIWLLLNLYVGLHNRYIHPYYLIKCK
jgi:hypothetical protein